MHDDTRPTMLDTKFGPLIVWATSAHHIGARTANDHAYNTDPAEAARHISINGVEYRQARIDAHTTHADEHGRLMLDGYENERAAYTAGVNPTIGTSWHGYGVTMYRVNSAFGIGDPTEAAARAFRSEVLEKLAEFVTTPEGRLMLARAEVRSKQSTHERAAEKAREATAEERAAAKELRAAEKALAKIECR